MMIKITEDNLKTKNLRMYCPNMCLQIVATRENVVAVRTVTILWAMGSYVMPSVTDPFATMETAVKLRTTVTVVGYWYEHVVLMTRGGCRIQRVSSSIIIATTTIIRDSPWVLGCRRHGHGQALSRQPAGQLKLGSCSLTFWDKPLLILLSLQWDTSGQHCNREIERNRKKTTERAEERRERRERERTRVEWDRGCPACCLYISKVKRMRKGQNRPFFTSPLRHHEIFPSSLLLLSGKSICIHDQWRSIARQHPSHTSTLYKTNLKGIRIQKNISRKIWKFKKKWNKSEPNDFRMWEDSQESGTTLSLILVEIDFSLYEFLLLPKAL